MSSTTTSLAGAVDVHTLLRIVELLDQPSRAALARTCSALRRVCSLPPLWSDLCCSWRSLAPVSALPVAQHVRRLCLLPGPRAPPVARACALGALVALRSFEGPADDLDVDALARLAHLDTARIVAREGGGFMADSLRRLVRSMGPRLRTLSVVPGPDMAFPALPHAPEGLRNEGAAVLGALAELVEEGQAPPDLEELRCEFPMGAFGRLLDRMLAAGAALPLRRLGTLCGAGEQPLDLWDFALVPACFPLLEELDAGAVAEPYVLATVPSLRRSCHALDAAAVALVAANAGPEPLSLESLHIDGSTADAAALLLRCRRLTELVVDEPCDAAVEAMALLGRLRSLTVPVARCSALLGFPLCAALRRVVCEDSDAVHADHVLPLFLLPSLRDVAIFALTWDASCIPLLLDLLAALPEAVYDVVVSREAWAQHWERFFALGESSSAVGPCTVRIQDLADEWRGDAVVWVQSDRDPAL
eukprot:m51a1_g7951 hypothetical protein (475) ;mRNA; r:163140-164634